jgi:hypothetical protein
MPDLSVIGSELFFIRCYTPEPTVPKPIIPIFTVVFIENTSDNIRNHIRIELVDKSRLRYDFGKIVRTVLYLSIIV